MSSIIHRTRVSRLVTVAAVLAVSVASSACKDDATAPQKMVATNTSLAMNSTITNALVGTTFTFAGGAGVLSPTLANQNLALAFAGTENAPTALITITSPTGAAVGTATANLTFGSCIFAVTNSSFPAGHALANGQTVVVNPCNVNIGTAGAVANGVATTRSIALVLGAAASAGQSVTVSVNAGGQLTLNGRGVGTVTLVPVSG